jgi:hypothetical protein
MSTPPEGRRFQKGQSGNPSGRPSNAWYRRWLEEKYEPGGGQTRREAYANALFQTAIDRRHKHHVDAARILIEYDLGKPKITAEISGPNQGPLPVNLSFLSVEEMERINAAFVEAERGQAVPDGGEGEG